MGNKDEKTFLDLFSSSKEEQVTIEQTFSDLLKGSNSEEIKQDTTPLTFDSLFDKIPPKEEVKEEAITNEPSFTSQEQTPKIELEQSQIETFGFNSIFKEEQPNDVTFENNITLSQEKIEETDNDDEEGNGTSVLFDFNSIFDNNQNEIQTKIEETTIDVQNKTVDPSINMKTNITTELKEEIEQNQIFGNNNLFFASNDKIKEPTTFEEKEPSKEEVPAQENLITETETTAQEETTPQEEIEFISNPFINSTNENLNINEELPTKNINEQSNNLEINPFFIEETSKIEEASKMDEMPKIEESQLEEQSKQEETNLEVNPFFEDNQKNNEESSKNTHSLINENSSNTVISSKQEPTPKEDITPISTSPFFEPEKKNEVNPFFQNQINLIENQAPNNPSSAIDTTNSKHFNVKIVKKKEPFIKVILGVLSYALFIWLLLIGTALLIYVLDIKIRAAKGDYSSPTFNAYVVLTGSMLPEIQVNDVVVTKKVDAAELKEGDVITFASADQRFLGTIITHRIIKKNPPTETQGYTFQTQGDNNNVADSALVPENNIFGKVILKIPKLGYLQEFLASDGGWIIVILIPCLTVISYDTVKLIKGLKRKKYKNIKVQK